MKRTIADMQNVLTSHATDSETESEMDTSIPETQNMILRSHIDVTPDPVRGENSRWQTPLVNGEFYNVGALFPLDCFEMPKCVKVDTSPIRSSPEARDFTQRSDGRLHLVYLAVAERESREGGSSTDSDEHPSPVLYSHEGASTPASLH
jgi:hypothetical protein